MLERYVSCKGNRASLEMFTALFMLPKNTQFVAIRLVSKTMLPTSHPHSLTLPPLSQPPRSQLKHP
jgi:hypothetical protein